jgi:DNA-binding transcriptional LysR family regulator
MSKLCTCNKLMGLIQIVASGGGIALLPKVMVLDQLKAGRMAMLPGNLPPQTLEFEVAVHRHQSQHAVARLVAELVQLSRTCPIGS